MPFDTGWGGGCCSGVVVKRTQLTNLVSERNQGATISMSAIKAGMSRTTARNYLRQDDVMEQRQVPHTWRTREDPLEEVWPRALDAVMQDHPRGNQRIQRRIDGHALQGVSHDPITGWMRESVQIRQGEPTAGA